MSDSVYKNINGLFRFLLRESDLLRSPVFVFVLVASSSRTGLIFLINETAARGSPTLWMFVALIACALTMLATSHWATISGTILLQRLNLKLRRRITKGLMNADVAFFQNRTHGEIFHASSGHVANVSGTALRIVKVSEAFLLLIFCLVYMAVQLPSSVVATLLAVFVGAAAFYWTEGAAGRAVKASHAATVAFNNGLHDLLLGYKELRLRRARRDDLSVSMEERIKTAQALSLTAERHYSYGQIGASAALLISIVVILPMVSGADSVTILQLLTLVLFSVGPIESLVGDLPAFARASISFRIFSDLEAALSKNAEHEAVSKTSDNRPSFETLELRGVTVHLSRDVGEDSKVKDTFTLGPIDLTLYPGQSVFITGGNGMGKSTLLHLLTGLRHPDEGEIRLDGDLVTRANVGEYRGVFAAVFSEFYMFKELFGLTDEERSRLTENIEEMGLVEGVSITDGVFDNLSLSTGQRRRLALSIALAEQRPILILDEFAADQDPSRRAFFYDELVPRLAKAGHCVVAVTHDDHCFSKCDRLIRMEDGKIVSDVLQTQAAQAG